MRINPEHIFHTFSAIANKAGLSREELNDQEHREMFIQDQRGGLSLAKKQGLKQDREEGAINMGNKSVEYKRLVC